MTWLGWVGLVWIGLDLGLRDGIEDWGLGIGEQ